MKTTNFSAGIRAIKEDENLLLRRNDNSFYYCFDGGVFSVRQKFGNELGAPIKYANKIGHEEFSMDAVLADCEILSETEIISETNA